MQAAATPVLSASLFASSLLLAPSVAVKYVGAETYRLCRDLVDGVVLVSNSEISAAIKARRRIRSTLSALIYTYL